MKPKPGKVGFYYSIMVVDVEKYYKSLSPDISRAKDVRGYIRGMISEVIDQGFTPKKAVVEPLPNDMAFNESSNLWYLAVRTYISLVCSRIKPLKKEGSIEVFYGIKVVRMGYGTEMDDHVFIRFEPCKGDYK